MRRFTTSTILSSLLLFAAVPAWAVPVTGGSIQASVINDFTVQADLTGPNFSFDCLTRQCGVLDHRSDFITSKGPLGTPVSLDSRFRIEQFGFAGSAPTNRLVLNGTTFAARGNLDFTTVGQVLRAPTVTGVSFTLAGNLDLLHPQTFADVGDVTLTGQGTVTAGFDRFGDGTRIVFDFTSPLANGGGPVIPEPSTVLLLASGLAGLGLWRRHRASQLS